MIAEIISIGDELLIGETVNNNAAFMGRLLLQCNVDVRWQTVTGDNVEDIVSAFENAWKRSTLILTTGGLGPTHDDMTKDALCRFFKTVPAFHPEIVDEVRERFRSRGKTMPEIVENQGLIPEGATLIRNEIGSAFGIRFDRDGRTLISMPGVPLEMKRMMTDAIVPAIERIGAKQCILVEHIRTAGLFESQLVTRFRQLDAVRELVDVAVLPKPTGVELRFTAKAPERNAATLRMAEAVQKVRNDLEQWIVSVGEHTMEDIVAELLIAGRGTVSTAESCTGGLVAHRLTNIPGSSAYMKGGVVSYSNDVKRSLLDVPPSLLDSHGAVSADVAEKMASGVKERMQTDYGLATTGIAGPGGGTEDKPVGLVYIAVAGPDGVSSERHHYPMDRILNKERFATAALDLLRRTLIQARRMSPGGRTQ